MVKPGVVFLSLSLVLPLPAQLNSQTSSSRVHNHAGMASTRQIDGAVNPEKIPDLSAYRLVFVVIGATPNAKPEEQAKEQARQQGHIKKIGLSEQDSQLLIPIVNEFRAKYATLIQQYNTYAEAASARGQFPDSTAFLAQRDSLVQATRDKLRVLTPTGVAQLDQHVQREKSGMKISPPALQ